MPEEGTEPLWKAPESGFVGGADHHARAGAAQFECYRAGDRLNPAVGGELYVGRGDHYGGN